MLLEVQTAVLRGSVPPGEEPRWRRDVFGSAEAGSPLESLMTGDFVAVLRSPRVLDLLRGGGDSVEGEDIETFLERRIVKYLSDSPEDVDRKLLVLTLTVSCIHMFAQSNWTGPPLSIDLSDLLPPPLHSSQDSVLSSLLLDGESVYSLVSNPALLLLARVVLTKCSHLLEDLQLLPWWTVRYVSLHQQILEARSQQLFSLAQSSIQEVLDRQSLLTHQKNLLIQFHLECVYTCLNYYEYQPAKEHINRAVELSGLIVNTTGALGKRTRFQENYLAQMILEVRRQQDQTGSDLSPSPTPAASLPKDYSLGDDTLLDKISLAEPDQFQLPDLLAEEQAVILGLCTDFQKNNPVHKLTSEELLAFTTTLLSQPKFWAIHVAALCLRTKLERGKTRFVERAMMQTQAIADHFENQSCPVTERLKIFYCCQPPTRWLVQKRLSSLMLDLGCLSSALLIYEKLELWEDAVICYERLGKHGKAEEIIRRELEKKETPSLYCLLGDVLRDHQYYDRAWELSGHRSARAMRSKALLHLRAKEFQQCADCFERSLKINHMQLGVWFSLGCAYFALESWDGAAKAFQRCVELEPDNAEAWNNLSTSHIRLNRKTRAFRSLQEALRCNYEHWQIWENYIGVSVDVGEFREAVRAYHQLMELKEDYKDIQVLKILVRAVVENLPDSQGAPAAALDSKLRELLGRVSARHSSDAEVWHQYARLYGSGRSANTEENEKALHFLNKALRCRLQASGWEKDPLVLKTIVERAVDFGEVTISCCQTKSNPSEALQMLSSARLSLRSLSTKAKQTHTDVLTGQLHQDLQDGVADLDRLVSELQELASNLRNSS
ncbi:tetratricopeptide repeat protein 27 [Neosynchiropus ocellatus]